MTYKDGTSPLPRAQILIECANTLRHFEHRLASARSILKKICSPLVNLATGDGIPRTHFPCAEMHLCQSRIKDYLTCIQRIRQRRSQYPAALQWAGKDWHAHRQCGNQLLQCFLLLVRRHRQISTAIAHPVVHRRACMPDKVKAHASADVRQHGEIEHHLGNLLHRSETVSRVSTDSPHELASKPPCGYRYGYDTCGGGAPI